VIERHPSNIDIVNLDDGNQAMDTQEFLQETQLPPNLTQESMKVHNLLLLLHLPARCAKGKEPSIDYSRSHIVTNYEYLDIPKKKNNEKESTKEIKAGKRKDKEDRQVKRAVELGSAVE
jgi:hypothetical protein